MDKQNCSKWEPIRVVGLDVSVSGTGIAVVDGGRVSVETVRTMRISGGPPKPSIVDRANRIVDKILDFIGPGVITIASVEEPIIKPGALRSSRRLIELNFLVCSTLVRNGVPVVYPVIQQLKQAATGNGRAEKDEIVLCLAGEFRVPISNDDEGDALAAALIGMSVVKTLQPERDVELGDLSDVRMKVAKNVLAGKNRVFGDMSNLRNSYTFEGIEWLFE